MRLLEHRPDFFTGAILVNPTLEFASKPGSLKLGFYKAKKLMGEPSYPVKLNYESKTQELLDFLPKEDPNFHFEWQTNNFLSMIEEQEKVQKDLSNVKTPLFLALSS